MDGIRAVLLEDDLGTCALMEAFFQGREEVNLCGIAHDGDSGIELIRSLEPDLVLLDLIMPWRSGVGVLDALREDPPPKRPKIIVISQISNEDTVRRVLAQGVNYYLMKPVSFYEILRVIRFLFKREPPEGTGYGLVEWLLKEMGAVETELGFRYTAVAAGALSAHIGEQRMLLKEAYHPIIHSDHTSYACVEKNIRSTVRKIHAANTDTYREIMGGVPPRAPKNSEFLPRLAARLQW